MKNMRIFLFISLLFVSAVTSLDAMKRQREEPIFMSIDVDKRQRVREEEIVIFEQPSQPVLSFDTVDFTMQATLMPVITECLYIRDSYDDNQVLLMRYLFAFFKDSPEEISQSLVSLGEIVGMHQLHDVFMLYKEYQKKRNSDELGAELYLAGCLLERVKDKNNSAIIFDVDDTALNTKVEVGGITVHGVRTLFSYYKARSEVQAFYQCVKNMGFKIFFLTSRYEKTPLDRPFNDGYEATLYNLQQEGYDTCEELICAPMEVRKAIDEYEGNGNGPRSDAVAQWKQAERNKIAQKFTIVGTLDDTQKNLYGINVGHAILIPSVANCMSFIEKR